MTDSMLACGLALLLEVLWAKEMGLKSVFPSVIKLEVLWVCQLAPQLAEKTVEGLELRLAAV